MMTSFETIIAWEKLNDLLRYEESENKTRIDKLTKLFNLNYNLKIIEKIKNARGNKNEIKKIFLSYFKNKDLFNKYVEEKRKSKKVKEFIQNKKLWFSNYSMGETIEIKYIAYENTKTDIIYDYRKQYKGKYRGAEKYGKCTLEIKLNEKTNKSKYTIIEEKKQ